MTTENDERSDELERTFEEPDWLEEQLRLMTHEDGFAR